MCAWVGFRHSWLHENDTYKMFSYHDDVIKWKHFPRYWPFVWGIHWPPLRSPSDVTLMEVSQHALDSLYIRSIWLLYIVMFFVNLIWYLYLFWLNKHCLSLSLSLNSAHKGQRRGALMFSLICAWINAWVNNSKAGDLRRDIAHYDVTIMMVKDGSMNNIDSRWLLRK